MSEFYGFLDEVRANNDPHRNRICGVGRMLQSLTGEDAEKVEAVLNDPSYSTAAIHTALRNRVEFNCPSSFTIGRHRRKSCGCFNNTRGAELK